MDVIGPAESESQPLRILGFQNRRDYTAPDSQGEEDSHVICLLCPPRHTHTQVTSPSALTREPLAQSHNQGVHYLKAVTWASYLE